MATYEDWQPGLVVEIPGAPDEFLRAMWCEAVASFLRETNLWHDTDVRLLKAGRTSLAVDQLDDGPAGIIMKVEQDGLPVDPRLWACPSPGVVIFQRPYSEDLRFTVTASVHPKPSPTMEIPDFLATEWFDGVKSAALARIYSLQGRPWFSRGNTDMHLNQLRRHIGRAKLLALRGHAVRDDVQRFPTWA